MGSPAGSRRVTVMHMGRRVFGLLLRGPATHFTALAAAAAAAAAAAGCSEKKLRRLEVANGSKRLSRLPLFRLLSHSEGRWADELARAGVAADGTRTGKRGRL
jgi:hypothetical protein